MGGGRKTVTCPPKEKSQPASSVNSSTTARNLTTSKLGGVIFGCKYNTIEECFQKQLFGLPRSHISYVKNIFPGLPLFLFNYSDRMLHGVFEAATKGRLDIDPHAWTGDGSDYTQFPAQVKFRIRVKCQPLSENQFFPVISDNYYKPRLFWFELDQGQTDKLISLFSSSPVTASSSLPECTGKQNTKLSNSWLQDISIERSASDLNVANQKQANMDGISCGDGIGSSGQRKCLEYDGRSYSSVLKNNGQSIGDSNHGLSGKSPLDTYALSSENESLDAIDNMAAWEHTVEISNDQFNSGWDSPCSRSGLNGHNNSSEDLFDQPGQFDEQFECSQQQKEDLYSSVATNDNCCLPQSVPSDGIDWSGQRKCLEYDGCSYSSMLKNNGHSIGNIKHARTGKSSLTTHGLSCENESLEAMDNNEALEHDMEISNDQFNSEQEWECIIPGLNGESNSSEEIFHQPRQFVATNDNCCLPQFVPCENLSPALAEWEGGYLENRALEGNISQSNQFEIENNCLSEADLPSNVKLPDVQFILDKIQQEVTELKLKQFKQEQKISSLEKELVESRTEIKNLKQQLNTSESCIDESILLIGGYDGLSYISALESYCPSNDVLETVCPMSSKRLYSSAVKLNNDVHVIGGLHDNLWYDTVESYNLVENRWVSGPSLNQKKGGLAGVSLNDKIFAIGGGNGVQGYSEVELLDQDVGRWILTRSMLNKRFTPAAAEINGMIYVVGGYDGVEYLKSVEGFDPRESSWSRLQSMSTKRGGHSLAVLNEKLYAIGGYNGERMTSTVELFDPRIGSWMMGESMNTPRRYFASVVIGNSVFVIGGLSENNEVLDTVECYKEGQGWQSTNLQAIGKRCYLSAVNISG